MLCGAIGCSSPGELIEGSSVAVCHEHRAFMAEQAQKPKPLEVVTLPLTAEEAYLQASKMAALGLA
jgi:hypothetical protein